MHLVRNRVVRVALRKLLLMHGVTRVTGVVASILGRRLLDLELRVGLTLVGLGMQLLLRGSLSLLVGRHLLLLLLRGSLLSLLLRGSLSSLLHLQAVLFGSLLLLLELVHACLLVLLLHQVGGFFFFS